MWLVLALQKTMTVSSPYGKRELPFSTAGYVGMCPVFESKEDAEKMADGRCEIVEISENQDGGQDDKARH